MKFTAQLLCFCFIVLFLGCAQKQPKPNTRFDTYNTLKSHITAVQNKFRKSYKAANENEKKALIKAARDTVFKAIITDYFSFWNGTKWSFHGTTRTPGSGSIACGYFVTTVLEDAGFPIPRVKWAQVASETAIRAMTHHLKLLNNCSISVVEKYIKDAGPGLYVAGLDNHIGFIYNNGKKTGFVHSTYYWLDKGVMDQKLDSNNPLKKSNYRIIGKILDDKMMESWITGKKMG